jgi:broad specificity phosphatase PhoE
MKRYEDHLRTCGRSTSAFPGGEDCHELVARIQRGLGTIAGIAEGGAVLVIAHGANLRAVLPALAGTRDPARDLEPGEVAHFEVTTSSEASISLRLLDWGLDTA